MQGEHTVDAATRQSSGEAGVVADRSPSLDLDAVGRDLYACVADLYPLCRSLTGDGLRETLRRLQRRIPLTLHEVPTGTTCTSSATAFPSGLG
jgi:hypothetical protein